MTEQTQEKLFVLKASDDVNLGMGIFALVSLGGVFLFRSWEWAFFEIIAQFLTAIFTATAIISPLFLQYREIALYRDKIQITKGLVSKKVETIPLKQIRNPKITKSVKNSGTEVHNLADAGGIENWNIDNNLEFSFNTEHSQTITLKAYNFKHDYLRDFLKYFRQTYYGLVSETSTSSQPTPLENPINQPEAKIDETENDILQGIRQCEYYISEDEKLSQEFYQAMYEAYISVYQTYTLQVDREGDELRLQKQDVLQYFSVGNYRYHYFLKDDYLANATQEEKEVADNLIATSQKNIDAIKKRIEAYLAVKKQLQEQKEKYLQRLKIQQLANRINTLQEKNLAQSSLDDQLSFDAEKVIQLSALTEQLHQSDLRHLSETLKQLAILSHDKPST
ncbi:YdbT family protein [Thermoflexibacter ruber]|uniref:Uncharacterized protein n=2 Tax=Thermoflexibacter ruber TaxID=1003 RepID=A0A1I2JXF8_9BACT|nr:hypothetical protein [Thermoflexibacter ruber]SFF58869.1 hypothetical protein SAMN04488541_10709 [Thermoflexibacter ruber]